MQADSVLPENATMLCGSDNAELSGAESVTPPRGKEKFGDTKRRQIALLRFYLLSNPQHVGWF